MAVGTGNPAANDGTADLRGLRAAKQDRGRQAPPPPCRWPSRHQEVLGTKGARAVLLAVPHGTVWVLRIPAVGQGPGSVLACGGGSKSNDITVTAQ